MNAKGLRNLTKKMASLVGLFLLTKCSYSSKDDYFYISPWEVEEVSCYKNNAFCDKTPFEINSSNVLYFKSDLSFNFTLYTSDIDIANKYGSLTSVVVEGDYTFIKNNNDLMVLRTDNPFLNGIYRVKILDLGVNGGGRLFSCSLKSPSKELVAYTVVSPKKEIMFLGEQY